MNITYGKMIRSNDRFNKNLNRDVKKSYSCQVNSQVPKLRVNPILLIPGINIIVLSIYALYLLANIIRNGIINFYCIFTYKDVFMTSYGEYAIKKMDLIKSDTDASKNINKIKLFFILLINALICIGITLFVGKIQGVSLSALIDCFMDKETNDITKNISFTLFYVLIGSLIVTFLMNKILSSKFLNFKRTKLGDGSDVTDLIDGNKLYAADVNATLSSEYKGFSALYSNFSSMILSFIGGKEYIPKRYRENLEEKYKYNAIINDSNNKLNNDCMTEGMVFTDKYIYTVNPYYTNTAYDSSRNNSEETNYSYSSNENAKNYNGYSSYEYYKQYNNAGRNSNNNSYNSYNSYNQNNSSSYSTGNQSSSNNLEFFKGCSSVEELDKRYKKLCQVYHPDSATGDSDTFVKLKAEYEKLKEKF